MFGLSFGTQDVSVTEAHEWLGRDGHCLIDVRTREEFRSQSVPGALNIPLNRIEAEASSLGGYVSIHVMCHSGGRSSMATRLLHDLGFTHAKNIRGGMLAWEAAGLPTV